MQIYSLYAVCNLEYTFQGIRILPVLRSHRLFSILDNVAVLFFQSMFTNS